MERDVAGPASCVDAESVPEEESLPEEESTGGVVPASPSPAAEASGQPALATQPDH
jgi:hypothetical protein